MLNDELKGTLKNLKWTILICLILLSGGGKKLYLRQKVEFIEWQYYAMYPLGTSIEEAIKKLDKTSFLTQDYFVNYDWGVQAGLNPDYDSETSSIFEHVLYVGDYSINVYLGGYGLLFHTDVSVEMGFDEEEGLVIINVWKDIDSF